MIIKNTFLSEDPEARRAHLAAIHLRCILLLRAARKQETP